MRLIILTLLLALIAGTAGAVPLQGSDGNATVVLFGSVRTPLADENATQEILKVDVGLVNTENATYELMDQNNNTYHPGLFKTLQEKRHLVYFLVPQDDLFKMIRVTPTGGKTFNINWWATPKSESEGVVIRYYGITDWLINPDEQGIVMQIRAANNGSKDLYLAPENFTLLDQWGWPYNPTLGFDPEVIAAQKASSTRAKVGFTGISLLSRPTALAYDYGTPGQIIISLEKDLVALSDEKVYGANATQKSAATPSISENATAALQSSNQAQSQPASGNETNKTASTTATKISSLKEQIAASKARLAGTENASTASTQSAVGKKINSSLSSTKERLAAAKANLHKSTQNETKSNAQNNITSSTTNSAA